MVDFDEAALTWDNDPVKLERARIVAEAIAAAVPLDASMDVLEYGSGTGQVSLNMAPFVGRITLADTSQGMLAVARQRVSALGTDQFRTTQLDLASQPAEPNAFDLVYTVMVLHHIEAIDTVLAAFHTTLRPGGWLCVVDLDHEHGLFHGHDEELPHHGFGRDALGHQLAEAGFSVLSFSTCHVVHKQVDGRERDFPLFLAVAQRPA